MVITRDGVAHHSRILPDGVYTAHDLRLILGLTQHAIVGAMRRGELRGTRQGRQLIFIGRWLIDWLERSAHRQGGAA